MASAAIFVITTPWDQRLSVSKEWMDIKYLGQRMGSNQKMVHVSSWQRTTPNGIAGPENVIEGRLVSTNSMERGAAYNEGITAPLLQMSESELAAIDAKYGIGSANKLVGFTDSNFNDFFGTLSAKFTSDGMIETHFVTMMVNHMSFITVKYFEYTLTAGLFLVGVLLTLHPNGDAYQYQVAFQGMMLCNLVAIPMIRAVVGCMNIKREGQLFSDYGWCVQSGAALLLIASMFFFFAGMGPVFSVVPWSVMSLMPGSVQWAIILCILIFFLFGLVGTVGTVAMMMNADPGKEAILRKWLSFKMIGFEFLNLFKWVIALVVVVGVLKTTPLG